MHLSPGKLGALAVLLVAAALEVFGDALIRKGMRGGGAGWLAFGDRIPASTWAGLGVIVAGSLIVHFGRG